VKCGVEIVWSDSNNFYFAGKLLPEIFPPVVINIKSK